jgi:hypothetical protein
LKDYSPHFRKLVEDHLPDDSRILMPHGQRDMIILATWRQSTVIGRVLAVGHRNGFERTLRENPGGESGSRA